MGGAKDIHVHVHLTPLGMLLLRFAPRWVRDLIRVLAAPRPTSPLPPPTLASASSVPAGMLEQLEQSLNRPADAAYLPNGRCSACADLTAPCVRCAAARASEVRHG